jgi:hypothetical protein
MILCKMCGKRMITDKILIAHMAKSHAETPIAPPVLNPNIVLHFKKDIEVGINGKWFRGKEIEVKDMATASEIVRIAKGAYGWDVLI